MKSIFDMNGSERAAALLIALGPEIASEIIKHLDEESIEKLSVEMARLDQLAPAEKEDLIGDFMISLKKEGKKLTAGPGSARELLAAAFGDEKADEIISRMPPVDVKKEFSFLHELEPAIISQLLIEELPQIITVTLTFLPSHLSARIMKELPRDTAKEVAVRMAKMKNIIPEAAVEVARALKKRYQKYLQEGVISGQTEGLNSLITILGHMNGEQERGILKELDESMPALSEKIRDEMVSFEKIVYLTNQDVRVVIDEVNNDDVLARALKGAGDDIRFKFVRNMSQNRATDILTEMDTMGAIRLKEVEECRGVIADIMRDLYDNGIIDFRRDGEVYVE